MAFFNNGMQNPQGQGIDIRTLISNARNLYQQMGNPEQFVQQYLPFIPPQIRNNPDAILQFMLSNGMINQQYLNCLQNAAPGVRQTLGL